MDLHEIIKNKIEDWIDYETDEKSMEEALEFMEGNGREFSREILENYDIDEDLEDDILEIYHNFLEKY